MGEVVETKVTFPNEEGTKLAGILVEPKSYPPGPRRVVVLLHGLYQHKNISMLKPFGERIPADQELGLATFRFDCRGLGESEGITAFTPHFINLLDLKAAVAHLEAERGFALHAIFGYSAGGNVAVMFAAERQPPVPYLSLHSPRFYMNSIRATFTPKQAEVFKASGEFEHRFTKRGTPVVLQVDTSQIHRFEGIDNVAMCRRIPAKTRTLVTAGLADARVPPLDTAGFSSNIANVQQHLLPGVGHEHAEEGAIDQLYEVWRAWMLGGAERAEAWRREAFARL